MSVTRTSAAWNWDAIGNASQALGTFVALVGVVVTLVMTLRSERLTRQGQQLERRQAESSAERSENAAALTEEYTRRAIEALESMAARGLGGGAPEPARRVAWALTHHGGDTYMLKNEGTASATGVLVKSHESLPLLHFQGRPEQMEPGEAITFMAAPSMGTSDMTITVQWQDEDAELRDWRYPLPLRPPRR